MEFNLSTEHKLIQKRARQFAETEIEPIAAKIDRERKIPHDMLGKLGRAGFLGMICPRQYGGADASFMSMVLTLEQLAYPVAACDVTAWGCTMVAYLISKMGSDEQKERYIRPICEGRIEPSWGFSEASTGSDPKSLQTTAELIGDHWVINGTKRFHSHGTADGPSVIFANTDGRTSAFLVDKNCEGYSCSRPYEFMGLRGVESVDTRLENVRVPKSALFGEFGKGYQLMLSGMGGFGKICAAAIAVGQSQAALDEALKYARQRTKRGLPIASMQGIQWMLAEMATKVEAARCMTYAAAVMRDQGQDVLKEGAMTKLFATRCAVEVADLGIQIHGAYGYTNEYKIERIYRSVKNGEIGGGSREVNKSIVAGFLLR